MYPASHCICFSFSSITLRTSHRESISNFRAKKQKGFARNEVAC